MKHKLKATITFEYEVDDVWYDPNDLHNITKTEMIDSNKSYIEWFETVAPDMEKWETKIEPVKE
jgi:hypothetical protein